MFTRKPEIRPPMTPSTGQVPTPASGVGADRQPPRPATDGAASVPLAAFNAAGQVQPINPGITNGTKMANSSIGQSVIGQDLSIEGQGIIIRCQGTMVVDGTVQAELHGREITVGEHGVVQGSVTADAVDVWGRVGGAIRGAKVILHASAQVDGDIHASTLAIEDGASFEGRSRKVTDPALIVPQLTPGSGSSNGASVPLPRIKPEF